MTAAPARAPDAPLLLSAFAGAPETGRVYHCDALTLLRAMPAGSVDCIITDPPYGIGKASWDTIIPLDWLAEAWRVSSRLIVMTGNPEMIEVGHVIGAVRNVVVMNARNGMTRSKTGFANWFPALVCGDWDWKPRPNYLPFNVSITETIKHPSPKPLTAMVKLIEKYTERNWLICDPFSGSGTTSIAAKRLGRRFIGSDVDLTYCEEARRRIAQPFTLPMFAETEAVPS